MHVAAMPVNWIYLNDHAVLPMNLSGRLIDAFLALEETRRFSVAAERCHMSPSAFSQMISRLEEQAGARLFDRDTRNVALTPEGEVFSQGAHRIAAEIQSAAHDLRQRAGRQVGRVSIAAPPSAAAAWIAPQLAAFRRDNPGIVLRLYDVVSDRCLDLVARGDVDLGLNAQPGNESEFEALHLFDERLHVVCRHDHPIASQAAVRLKDLRGEELIHTVHSGSVWQQTHAMLDAARAGDSGFEVAQFGTLAALVENGLGISVVPTLALRLCSRPALVAVPLSDRKARRPMYMVKRRQRSLSIAAQAMWERLVADAPMAQRQALAG
ncbi:MAG: LysR family transcriptional regulator [Ramlibacter sp.]